MLASQGTQPTIVMTCCLDSESFPSRIFMSVVLSIPDRQTAHAIQDRYEYVATYQSMLETKRQAGRQFHLDLGYNLFRGFSPRPSSSVWPSPAVKLQICGLSRSQK